MARPIPIRVLLAKAGLDGHDRGAKIVARSLREAGMEVLYTGLRQTPEKIVAAAVHAHVDCLGLSMLSGAHNGIVPRIVELLRAHPDPHTRDILLILGGAIPIQDEPSLLAAGVAAIFGPCTPLESIATFIQSNVKPRAIQPEVLQQL
jgi:methylmalonyl-CoA mutase C-terminal domain/subunit